MWNLTQRRETGVVLDGKGVAQGQPGYGNPHVNPGLRLLPSGFRL